MRADRCSYFVHNCINIHSLYIFIYTYYVHTLFTICGRIGVHNLFTFVVCAQRFIAFVALVCLEIGVLVGIAIVVIFYKTPIFVRFWQQILFTICSQLGCYRGNFGLFCDLYNAICDNFVNNFHWFWYSLASSRHTRAFAGCWSLNCSGF